MICKLFFCQRFSTRVLFFVSCHRNYTRQRFQFCVWGFKKPQYNVTQTSEINPAAGLLEEPIGFLRTTPEYQRICWQWEISPVIPKNDWKWFLWKAIKTVIISFEIYGTLGWFTFIISRVNFLPRIRGQTDILVKKSFKRDRSVRSFVKLLYFLDN